MTKKPYPKFESDEEEQAFLDTANLEDYDSPPGACRCANGSPIMKICTRTRGTAPSAGSGFGVQAKGG